jgi:hypothetical protein
MEKWKKGACEKLNLLDEKMFQLIMKGRRLSCLEQAMKAVKARE